MCHSCHHQHYHRPSRRNLASNAGIITYTHIEQLATGGRFSRGLVAASPTDTTAFCFQDRGIELHRQHQLQAVCETHRLAAWRRAHRQKPVCLSSVSPTDTQNHTRSGRIASQFGNLVISLDAYAHSQFGRTRDRQGGLPVDTNRRSYQLQITNFFALCTHITLRINVCT